MDNLTLIESFSEFKDDKLIDRVTLMAILEEVFRSALRRKYGDDENFDIIINPDKGDLEIWRTGVSCNPLFFMFIIINAFMHRQLQIIQTDKWRVTVELHF